MVNVQNGQSLKMVNLNYFKSINDRNGHFGQNAKSKNGQAQKGQFNIFQKGQ